MIEIYWLTRLDSIKEMLTFLIALGVFTAIISIICYAASETHSGEKRSVSFIKGGVITALLVGIFYSFVPTSKEAFLIWGVGGTLDYLKTNEKARQLPDKCIDYLDEWVKHINNDKKNQTPAVNNVIVD